MNNYWFKQKTFGYGITPISWEGWLATIIFALFIVSLVKIQVPIIAENFLGLLIVLAEVAIISIAFLKLVQSKCEGRLSWRWGNKK